jgi:hypothetical protein
MQAYRVYLYRLAAPALGAAAGKKPVEEPGFAVDAFTLEEAREKVKRRLLAYGEQLRSLSFTPDGALLAVLYARG